MTIKKHPFFSPLKDWKPDLLETGSFCFLGDNDALWPTVRKYRMDQTTERDNKTFIRVSIYSYTQDLKPAG